MLRNKAQAVLKKFSPGKTRTCNLRLRRATRSSIAPRAMNRFNKQTFSVYISRIFESQCVDLYRKNLFFFLTATMRCMGCGRHRILWDCARYDGKKLKLAYNCVGNWRVVRIADKRLCKAWKYDGGVCERCVGMGIGSKQLFATQIVDRTSPRTISSDCETLINRILDEVRLPKMNSDLPPVCWIAISKEKSIGSFSVRFYGSNGDSHSSWFCDHVSENRFSSTICVVREVIGIRPGDDHSLCAQVSVRADIVVIAVTPKPQ